MRHTHNAMLQLKAPTNVERPAIVCDAHCVNLARSVAAGQPGSQQSPRVSAGTAPPSTNGQQLNKSVLLMQFLYAAGRSRIKEALIDRLAVRVACQCCRHELLAKRHTVVGRAALDVKL